MIYIYIHTVMYSIVCQTLPYSLAPCKF
jgi:hypothetical protein